MAPVRQEIVDALDVAGPCAVARLAELVGRPADALYHHLRVLQRAGVVASEARKEGRHVFAVYDLRERPVRLPLQQARPDDVLAVAGAAQRLSWRDFRAAVRAGEGVAEGEQRTLWGSRARGWLTPGELARVNAWLARAIELLRRGGPAEGRVPVSLSVLLSPSPPRARGKGGSRKTSRTAGRRASRKGARS